MEENNIVDANTMDITQFVSNFKTHPILFVGSGMSRRYLKNSPDWQGLLTQIAIDIWGDDNKYLELAEKFQFNAPKIAAEYENLFKEEFRKNPKFEKIKITNDDNIRKGILISPFKIYLSDFFSHIDYVEEKIEEIEKFKSLKNCIKSIVTTNYDGMLEDLFEFKKLIGNNILLSSQYGTIYKMHGCYSEPNKIIFTEEDYGSFKEKNKLITAQLISLFIHSPVIFLGYGTDDENVNSVLEIIFSYVGDNQFIRDKIKSNFLVVEYSPNSTNKEVSDLDKGLGSRAYLSLNKISTDNYKAIYEAILGQPYAIESEQLRLVDNLMQRAFVDSKNKENAQIINYIAKDIRDKGFDNVGIVGAIGTPNQDTSYREVPVSVSQDYFIENYFEILDKNKVEDIKLIDTLKPKIAIKTYFPIFGFNSIISKSAIRLVKASDIKDIQEKSLTDYISSCRKNKNKHVSIPYTNIEAILKSNIHENIQHQCICLNVWDKNISITSFEKYLRSYKIDNINSNFRRLITLFDYMKYSISNIVEDEDEDEDNIID